MDESFAQILGDIKEKYESTLASLVGSTVIKRIQPPEEVGIMSAFVFDNGAVLEIGVPLYVSHLSDVNVSCRVDYARKNPMNIIESFDIYSFEKLREKLKIRRNYTAEDLEERSETGGGNLAIITYLEGLLETYQEHRKKAGEI